MHFGIAGINYFWVHSQTVTDINRVDFERVENQAKAKAFGCVP